jgi:uncharacterized protein YlaI
MKIEFQGGVEMTKEAEMLHTIQVVANRLYTYPDLKLDTINHLMGILRPEADDNPAIADRLFNRPLMAEGKMVSLLCKICNHKVTSKTLRECNTGTGQRLCDWVEPEYEEEAK